MEAPKRTFRKQFNENPIEREIYVGENKQTNKQTKTNKTKQKQQQQNIMTVKGVSLYFAEHNVFNNIRYQCQLKLALSVIIRRLFCKIVITRVDGVLKQQTKNGH